MTVMNDLFDYGLKIYQDTDFFKFSIDSILLAEFIDFKPNNRILDICTGNAPLPLILSTYDKSLDITGIEIQPEIADLAKKSIEENALQETIKIINTDIKNYSSPMLYDIVTCNPPYFKDIPTSEKNLNEIKKIARHEVTLTLEEAISSASRLLNSNGTFYIVHRIERFLETCKILENKKLGIRKTVFVYTKKDKPAEFFLMEASKCKKNDLKVESLYIENLKTYKNIFKEG